MALNLGALGTGLGKLNKGDVSFAVYNYHCNKIILLRHTHNSLHGSFIETSVCVNESKFCPVKDDQEVRRDYLRSHIVHYKPDTPVDAGSRTSSHSI